MAVVAIVGRPNVGKSTLFNALIRENRAIVGPQRGITRDRIYGRWQITDDRTVDIVDTGGFDTLPGDMIEKSMREQTLAAINDAYFIICLLDALGGITPDDEELIELLRRGNSNPIFVANKVDDPNSPLGMSMLYETGIGDFIEISASKRKGLKTLAAAVMEQLERLPEEPDLTPDGAIRVSILGRPNVGKSMLINRIIGEERAIVSPVAGTTRDYVDIPVEIKGQNYLFVDTAGIRRRSRIDDRIEKMSVTRSIRNVSLSHVCLFLVDPQEGVTEQDRRLCNIIQEQGRAFVVVVNKSDLLSAEDRKQVAHRLGHSLRYLPDQPVVFVSALTGKKVERLFPMINDLYRKTTCEHPTARINKVLQSLSEAYPPPMIKGRRIKFYYANQIGTIPPRFRIVTNRPAAIPVNYQRYLEKGFKKELDLEGITIKTVFAGR